MALAQINLSNNRAVDLCPSAGLSLVRVPCLFFRPRASRADPVVNAQHRRFAPPEDQRKIWLIVQRKPRSEFISQVMAVYQGADPAIQNVLFERVLREQRAHKTRRTNYGSLSQEFIRCPLSVQAQ